MNADQRAAEGFVVPVDRLRGFASDLLCAAGMPRDEAALAARVIVDANVRGVDTHGVFLLSLYVRRMRAGLINPTPAMRFERRRAAIGVLDADGGMGHVATARAMEHAVALAREAGVATVLVTRSNHFGAAAYYAMWAARHNCVGTVWSPAESSVVPFGGSERFFGTNPIAISAPPGERYPGFTLDMATSAVAGGKIYAAGKNRKTIPEGWAIDREGRPVTQPSDDDAILGSYIGLPAAGAKGYGLATMIEFTTSLLMGTQWGPTIVRWSDDFQHNVSIAHYVQALDVEAFVDIAEYRRRVDEFCAALKAVPPASAPGEVLLPGEPELRTAERRAAAGCPLTPHVAGVLRALAAEVGLPFTLAEPA
jgi:ureidoglycolate dehydrogenase (NAD+)